MDMLYHAPLTQAEAEHVTGLSREVLRKWELRYQFPQPVRGERGQRLYAQSDVERLQRIARLVHCGLRPHKLMGLSMADLQAMLDCWGHDADASQHQTDLLTSLSPGCEPGAVRTYLEQLINENGLAKFVQSLLPVLNDAVGNSWAKGLLGVHMEHHYTEAVRQTLYARLAKMRPSSAHPRVLLTTPPGELHGLGMMGLQVALALQGAHCVSLGTQTPGSQVLQSVLDLGIGVVAISISECLQPEVALRYLSQLRLGLPTDCHLWVGGRGILPLEAQIPQGVAHFGSVAQAVSAWQKLLRK
jgi:DNA-binding transcriptional MerR regulator